MYQGLGETYINVFVWLTAWSFVAAAVLLVVLRLFKRFSFGWGFAGTLLLGASLAFGSNSIFHRRMFIQEHQRHNTLVPTSGCVRYEPSFGHLFAIYEMTATEFESWVAQHPWQLVEYDQEMMEYEQQKLGVSDPEETYATEMASNGAQLRVYFKDGRMYLSYNVM
ncbi:MAG: hypothetical protein AAFX06_29520 [Planctomycetota bacterium]